MGLASGGLALDFEVRFVGMRSELKGVRVNFAPVRTDFRRIPLAKLHSDPF